MAIETVDGLELVISTKAQGAADSIRDLSTAVSSFGKEIGQYVGNLKVFADAIKDIANVGKTLGMTGHSIRGMAQAAAEAGKKIKDSALGSGKNRGGSANEPAKINREIEAAAEAAKRPFTIGWTASQEAARRKQSSEQWKRDMEAIAARQAETEIANESEALRNLRSFASLNTPEHIAAQREAAIKRKDLQGFNDFFGKIPDRADAAASAGIISPEMAQAMKDAFNGVKTGASEASEAVQMTASAFVNTVSQADLLQMKLDGVGGKLEEALNAENQDPAKIASLVEQYDKLKQKIEEAGEAAEDNTPKLTMKDVFGAIGKDMEKSIFGQLARVAKMRGLRAIVKGAASAFKEGVSNMYQWSKGLGGAFADALDTAASKTMLMKNSIAAALAPALQALVPLLSTVASWVRDVSNAVAQFFALLTGQSTWTMATESAQEWAKETKSGAGGASKAMKDLLADWDELNIIQSQSGGGGGGGGGSKAADFGSMFKEMKVFDDWTKQFDEIKKIVAAIGVGIAGWFAVSSVQRFLERLGIAGGIVDEIFGRIKEGIVGAVLLTVGFELSMGAGRSYAQNGFTWAGFAENVIGAISAGLGGTMLAAAFGVNPAIGLALGLGLSLYGTVKGFELEQTETAHEYIRGRLEREIFKFDVRAVADEVDVTIQNAEKARKEVRTQLESTLQTMQVIELGIDNDKTWDTLYNQISGSDGLISKIQSELTQDANVLTLYYSLSEKMGAGLGEKDDQGNYKNLESFKIDMEANTWLQDEYTRLGEKFASCFVEGEKNKIAEGKEELALEISKQIAEAERAAEEARGEAQASIDMTNMMKGTDATHVIRDFGLIVDEYEGKIAEARKSALEGYITTQASTLAQLEKLGADESLIAGVRKNLEEAQKELKNTDFKAEVHLEYAEKEKKMLQDFIRENVSEITGWDNFKNGTITKAVQMAQTPEELAQRWGWQLYGAANTALGLDFDSTVLKDFGVSLADILGEDIEDALADLAFDRFGPEGGAAVMSSLGMGDSEMEADITGIATDATVQDLNSTVGTSFNEMITQGNQQLKGQQNIVTEIRRVANRPVNVNISPSSGLGNTNRKSGAMFGRIDGSVAMEQ